MKNEKKNNNYKCSKFSIAKVSNTAICCLCFVLNEQHGFIIYLWQKEYANM